MNLCIQVCMHLYMHVPTCMYIHTYILSCIYTDREGVGGKKSTAKAVPGKGEGKSVAGAAVQVRDR